MEIMTAEQAREAAKGLTFEDVWAALMEDRRKAEESRMEWDKRMAESKKESDRSKKEMAKSKKEIEESQKRMEKTVADLSKNIGGLNNSLGELTEALFSPELNKKFDELGFTFVNQSVRKKFQKDGKTFAEVDSVLENGEYTMFVEVKTKPDKQDITWHLERIEKIRKDMDERGDNRKIVGAVAGGIISEAIMKYAQQEGLFVIVQSGESVKLADMPEGFKAREW
jgi:hypothetical protein